MEVRGGDGIKILAPTQQLIDDANTRVRNYNDCSYVVLYQTLMIRRIIFGGDSHDGHLGAYLGAPMSLPSANIDLLIAPHHGRDSGPVLRISGCPEAEVDILWERSI